MADSKQLDALMRRFYLILGALAICIIVPVLGVAYYLDSRLNSFQTDLSYRPPGTAGTSTKSLDALPWVPTQGQVVYVPAYSHIYHQRGRPQLLTVTLSVRNTALDGEIVLTSVRYYDTEGKLVRSYLEKPLSVGPLATTEFVVEREDTSGGSGANFIVEWSSGEPVTEPIIEAVMIDTSGNQGISFVREAAVIQEIAPTDP